MLSIGAGCTEVAVIASGRIVSGNQLAHRWGGLRCHAIVEHLVEHFDMPGQ